MADTVSTLVQDWVLSSITRRCTTILSRPQGLCGSRPAGFDRSLASVLRVPPRQQFWTYL
jgi:hypothetical protein